MDSLRARVELSGPEDTSAYNLLLSETRRMGQKKLEDLHKDIAGMPAFFYMDLPDSPDSYQLARNNSCTP